VSLTYQSVHHLFAIFSPLIVLQLCCGEQVIRGGRRIQVSIFDLVVGDVVALKIGDQVGRSKQILSALAYVCVACIPDIITK
jgi:Ca2+-transporting ATPase